MNKEAILHIPKSQYAFAYNQKELRIRLRAAKDDLDIQLADGQKKQANAEELFGCALRLLHGDAGCARFTDRIHFSVAERGREILLFRRRTDDRV